MTKVGLRYFNRMAILNRDVSDRVRRRFPQIHPAPPLVQFGLVAGAGGICLTALEMALFSGVPIPAMAAALSFYICGAGLAGYAMHLSYPHALLGFCNTVTLFRLVLVSALVVPLVAGSGHVWAVFGLAALALSLDGLDGWLARRDGLVSRFGAAFDMEVDSVFALLLALLAFLEGTAGPLVLILGLPRYLFALAGMMCPWLNAGVPERFSRKVVCVVQILTLIALQLPFFSPLVANFLVGAVAMALVWSFGRDVQWLWRARG